jgi:dihydroorotate dehydrogenase
LVNPVSTLDALYRWVLRPYLFGLDAETAHRLTLAMLSVAPPFSSPKDPPELRVKLWDIDFSNPVGLAAGMDKDAIAVGGWQTLGFGFAELGTITPLPQPGNDAPRIWRVRERRALINSLGFPSEGMETVARRIERIRKSGIAIRLALNFGPNKTTPPSGVAADYVSLMARMGALADFVVINVSSPNTPGLRTWQSPERMREIFDAMHKRVGDGSRRPPILLKIAPDLERDDLHRICDTALELKLDGIVASNTTVEREGVGVTSPHPGGLSGPPLKLRARELIRNVYAHTGGKIPIIGVGGIASAEDAWLHIRAGASMVELYTGLIYEGPALIVKIKAGLADLLRRDGFRSISDVVGIDK